MGRGPCLLPSWADRLRGQGYVWVTLVLCLGTLLGHFTTGLRAFAEEQAQHGAAFAWSGYLLVWARDVFENLQSEFAQLIWQVWGLSFLLARGSPQSKDEAERVEAKIDELRSEQRRAIAMLVELRRL
jgi:uncharacterized protein DUF6766